MPVQVAMPYLEDEGRNRTISSYGQEYSPVYVENMKRYLGEKLGEIGRYNRGETDPLEMPIGYDAGSGIAAITKNEALRQLGKAAVLNQKHTKYLMDYSKSIGSKQGVDYHQRTLDIMKGRLKDITDEIRSAPEIFGAISEIRYKPKTRNEFRPLTGTINLDSEAANAKSLRHELYHAWKNYAYPGSMSNYIRDYSRADAVANTVSQAPDRVVNLIRNKYLTWRPDKLDILSGHGYHPEEIAAIAAEDVPLKSYENANIYDVIDNLYSQGLAERQNKEETLFRLLKQHGR